jgi:hypothetical protein
VIQGIDDRVAIAFLTALLTFAITRLVDRVRAREEVRHLARATALPLLGLARALELHSKMLDEALGSDDDKLRGFYKFVVELVPAHDLGEFNAQVRVNSRLPHDVLAGLRQALSSIARAQTRYEQVRQVLEMSGAVRMESEGVGRLVVQARDATRVALEHLRSVSPADTRSEIVHIQREIK